MAPADVWEKPRLKSMPRPEVDELRLSVGVTR
jgi:hypothetical protein